MKALPIALLLLAQLSPAAPARDWENDIRAFEAADRASPPPKGAVLFVGASGIRRWTTLAEDFPGWTVVNRGFGGSELDDATRYAGRIIVPHAPRVVVLQSGTNDIDRGKTPGEVLAAWQRFVGTVRATLPQTPVVLVAISPSPKRWGQVERVREANRLGREWVAGERGLFWADVSATSFNEQGELRRELFVEDGVHLTRDGNRLRAAALRPVIAAALQAAP